MTSSPKTFSKSEFILSSAILIILGLITAWLLMTQSRFSPAVVMLDDPRQSLGTDAASDGPGPESIIGDIDTLAPLTAPERFDRQSLSDKINGKAELYLSAGFKGLISQRFSVAGATSDWFELFIYDMEKPDNAFAVYGMQQRDNAVPLELGSHAYQTENALFWVHGRFYGEVVGSAASPPMLKAMAKATRAFMSQNTVTSVQSKPHALFPPTARVADSIALIPADAFGFDRMDQVYTAEFRFDDGNLTAFVSKRADPQEARQLRQSYLEFLNSFGGQPLALEISEPNFSVISLMDAHEIVFASGPYVAGIHDAVNLQNALKLALDMKKHLEEQ